MVLQLDGNQKSEDQNFQALQRDLEASNGSRKRDHSLTAKYSSPILLIAPRFPYGSMGASLLFHAVVFLTLAFVQFPRKKSSWIDFEHEKITYYTISQNLPDISPSSTKTQSLERELGASDRPNQLPPLRSETEIAIRPTEERPAPLFLEQPQLPQVSALPRLELPNILMNRPKTEAGEEPISVSQEVVRDLNQELKQKADKISAGLRTELGVPEPLPMQQSPYLQGQDLKTKAVVPNTTPQLSLPLPEEPTTVSPAVSQLEYRAKSLAAGASLLMAPPLDEPGKREVSQLPSQINGNILIYSSNPVLPKGELRIPKVNVSGTLSASIQGGSGKGAGNGAPEFGNASIAIPGVSIKNRVPLLNAGVGVAVVQAPKPPMPVEENRKEDKPTSARLDDLLPPLHRSLKLPSYRETAKLPSESPLEEVEREGKQVYSATINVLNLTSKRGSWVFRFTDFSDPSKPVSQGNDNPTNESLTPLSAVVKVDPRYPPEAIRGKVEGVVVLYAIIRQDGKIDPESVRLIRKLDPRLDLSAQEALLQWRFKPSQKNGRPVDIQAEISVPFYFRRDPLQP